MKNKTVTLKILAQQIGLTPATISKALRDSSDISKATITKVKALADELGYQPNFMARTLVNKRSNIIGVIVPVLSESFFGFMVHAINETARKNGYETIILMNNEDHEIEKKNLEFLSMLQVDGICIDSVPGSRNLRLKKKMIERGVPFVSMDRKCDGIETDTVSTDDIKASYSMVKHFINNAKKNIAFVGAIESLSVARERYKGYKKALKDFNIKYDKNLVVSIKVEIDQILLQEQIKALLKSKKKIDAIVCAGGQIAYLVGKVLNEQHISIPNEIALGEFGDNNIVHRLGVPFVTIDQTPYEIGKKAVETLLDRLKNKDLKTKPRHIKINSQLIYHNPAVHEHILIEKI